MRAMARSEIVLPGPEAKLATSAVSSGVRGRSLKMVIWWSPFFPLSLELLVGLESDGDPRLYSAHPGRICCLIEGA